MLDELKAIDTAGLKMIFEPTIDESKLANVKLRLADGRCLTTRQHRRRMATLNRASKAAEQIGKLPSHGESLHCILNGSFALFDFIPAALQLAGDPIDELVACTLGFSARNVQTLGQLVDAGQVKRVAVLCSHYFAAADAPIYAHAVALCVKHGFRIAAMRTHAKLLLMAIGKRRLIVESSANLRSCHNVEQATIYDDPTLYDFHRGWIDELINKADKESTP